MPLPLVTVTSTVPVPAGEVAVIEVAELTVTAVPALAPNETVELAVKPVPVIVTTVPPASGPGVRADGGDGRDLVAEEVSHAGRRRAIAVGDRDIDRAGAAGLVAVIEVEELTVMAVPALAPNETVELAVKPVPVMVTTVPPASGPVSGLMAVTVGVS